MSLVWQIYVQAITARPFMFTVIEDDGTKVTIEVSEEDYQADLAAGIAEEATMKPGRYNMKRGGFLARHPELKLEDKKGRDGVAPVSQELRMSRARTLTGQQGAEAVIGELAKRGHVVKGMPNHNKGFDVDCQSPNGCKFRIEVKTSSSKNTQIPMQLHHVEGNLKPDLFFVLVKKLEAVPFFEYYVLTHEELKAAWILMPKQMMNERPYIIDRAHIDWRLVELQQNRWYKLPK